jgi:hypothetical protein
MNIIVTGVIFEWRGPAPFLFVAIPDEASRDIKAMAPIVTYGWGVIPVHVRLGNTSWRTSLFPKNGRYLIPIKVAVQRAEQVGAGDEAQLEVTIS